MNDMRGLADQAMDIHDIQHPLDLYELRARFDDLALIVSKLAALAEQRLAALEARVEQLENHPAGCSCTRCTG